jgi:hypothetical protein
MKICYPNHWKFNQPIARFDQSSDAGNRTALGPLAVVQALDYLRSLMLVFSEELAEKGKRSGVNAEN